MQNIFASLTSRLFIDISFYNILNIYVLLTICIFTIFFCFIYKYAFIILHILLYVYCTECETIWNNITPFSMMNGTEFICCNVLLIVRNARPSLRKYMNVNDVSFCLKFWINLDSDAAVTARMYDIYKVLNLVYSEFLYIVGNFFCGKYYNFIQKLPRCNILLFIFKYVSPIVLY